MTPEEKAVIEAAIEWRNRQGPIWHERLMRAVDALAAPPAEWTPATFADCLAGDRIRIGAEETTVLRASRGIWHADTRDAWRPKAWEHIEAWLELEAVPGLKLYPPNEPIEILMTPERLAVHTIAQAFPGSTVLEEGDTRA